MEKEKFILKLNIKDYNNQLEKILSKKTFSEDTKNLLLSMLYKVENSYADYNLANGDTKNKKEILEEILKIIEQDCEKIEIVKTKESKSILEENKIITYLNARKMLYEIYQIKHEKFVIPTEYEIIKPALEETLNQGYSIASNEIIRDFDGWSWNIAVDEIENIKANFVYQILKILIGTANLDKWQKGEINIEDIKEILQNNYNIELAEKLFKVICQIAILNVASTNEEEKNRLIERQEQLQNEFEEIDDKKKYLSNLGSEKKKIVEAIKKIDDAINNDKKLKNEFIDRNQNLDMNHRIFSLSDLVEILEKEREDLINKLDIYNKKMEPMNFLKTKTEIEEKLILLKEIDLKNLDEKTYITKAKELLKLVCEAIEIRINKTNEKESLIKLLYIIRYYSLIYITNRKQIKNTVELNSIQKMIITKACKEKVITIFSKNIKENYEILKNILNTDIIELEKIYLKIQSKDENTILEIYDEENDYKTLELPKVEELNVKLNKKIKVFI